MSSDPLARAVLAAACVAALAGCAANAGAGSASSAAPRTDPMTLKVTGESRTCIPNRSGVSTRPAGDSVLMFRASASSWFRNELRSRCPSLRDDRVLVFRSSTSQHCELDPFDIVDPVSRINFGTCSLGRFTPVEVPRGTRF